MASEHKEFLTAPTDQPVRITAAIENADDGRVSVIYKNWTKPDEDGVLEREVEDLDLEKLLDELGFHDLVVAGIRASASKDAAMKVAVTVAADEILPEKTIPFDGPAAVLRLNILTFQS